LRARVWQKDWQDGRRESPPCHPTSAASRHITTRLCSVSSHLHLLKCRTVIEVRSHLRRQVLRCWNSNLPLGGNGMPRSTRAVTGAKSNRPSSGPKGSKEPSLGSRQSSCRLNERLSPGESSRRASAPSVRCCSIDGRVEKNCPPNARDLNQHEVAAAVNLAKRSPLTGFLTAKYGVPAHGGLTAQIAHGGVGFVNTNSMRCTRITTCAIDFSLRACAAIVRRLRALATHGGPSVAANSAVSAVLHVERDGFETGGTRELCNRRLLPRPRVGRTSVYQALEAGQ
jgi:hypothetical protein